jgi:hypothetical protein
MGTLIKAVFAALCVVALFVGLVGVVLQYNGLLDFKGDGYQCLGGRRYYGLEQQRLLAVGSVSVYYHPLAFGCQEDHRYQPGQWHVENGVLVPN